MSDSPSEIIAKFEASLRTSIANAGRDAFTGMSEELALLAQSPLILKAMLSELQAYDDGESNASRFNGGELVLSASPDWVLALALYSQPLVSTITTVANLGLACLINGQASFDLYPLPADFEPSIYDPNLRLGTPKRVPMVSGKPVLIDGRLHAIRLNVQHPSAMLRLFSSHFCDFQWQFDPATLSPTGMAAARQEDTELESMLMMAAELKTPRHVELLLQAAQHRNHTLRWKSIQLLAGSDQEQALRSLHDALDDPHPEIRHAAAHALQTYQAGS